MSYKVERNIVVPDKYVQNASGFVAPFRQVHIHSTANQSAPLDNEVAYLSRNYQNGNYTHLVGENGRIIQVAEVCQGAFDVGGSWNAETYAAIEFGERVTSQDDFNASYRAYIELARDLAKEAGIPLREIVIMFYIANEGISFIENVSEFLPLPQKMKDIFIQIREKDVNK